MSAMIEVDPELFIKCRLCLEETGHYQIVPKVQEQIKFCYDIDVDSFDGLPQLICKNCEAILRNYFETKTLYINKQRDLKTNISLEKVPVLKREVRNSSEDSSPIVKKSVKRKKYSRINSKSSDVGNIPSKKVNKSYVSENSLVFSFYKQFACKFCNYVSKNRNDLIVHVRNSHKQLKDKYHDVLKKQCLVPLERLDDKLNFTGLNKTIVFDSEKIIENVNADYFIFYTYKCKQKDNHDNHSESSDNSDSEIIARKRKKKRCLFSSSSTDTEIITPSEPAGETAVKTPEPTVTDKIVCIDIDDSSESDNESRLKAQEYLYQKQLDSIQNIISVCQSNYRISNDDSGGKTQNKNVNLSSYKESLLKHKVLSIGTKVLKRQGFNCTGLLRYMEHKNLEINWTPTVASQSEFLRFIRIMTKSRANVAENESGWKNLLVYETAQKTNVDSHPLLGSQLFGSHFATQNQNNPIMTQDTSKLLNKNPVSNPKQLPKTLHIVGAKPSNSKVLPRSDNLEVCFENSPKDINDCTVMPIITSTKSLAAEYNDNSNKADDTPEIGNVCNQIGRIKVKPVSELMSETVLNNMMKENSPGLSRQGQVVNNCSSTTYASNALITYKTYPPHIPLVGIQEPNTTLNLNKLDLKNSDYVILDTVELPNTKTTSPFRYVQNLLQLHNLVLLNTTEKIDTCFVCLIKFKVKYKQEFRDQPVVLCLSLFCYNNTFYIKMNDRNHEYIDIMNIPGHWQWEIIKTFVGETEFKLHESATKINKEVSEYTKKFCCLIKSINFSRVL